MFLLYVLRILLLLLFSLFHFNPLFQSCISFWTDAPWVWVKYIIERKRRISSIKRKEKEEENLIKKILKFLLLEDCLINFFFISPDCRLCRVPPAHYLSRLCAWYCVHMCKPSTGFCQSNKKSFLKFFKIHFKFFLLFRLLFLWHSWKVFKFIEMNIANAFHMIIKSANMRHTTLDNSDSCWKLIASQR
jgi:hypothetical protein